MRLELLSPKKSLDFIFELADCLASILRKFARVLGLIVLRVLQNMICQGEQKITSTNNSFAKSTELKPPPLQDQQTKS